MDGVIPVEVASFRLGERLVSGVQCGAQLFGSGRNRSPREGLRFLCFQASGSILPPVFGVITIRPSSCTTMRSIRCCT